ncbi:MAG: patatin-like phospholipase family protein [Myxococcales bacterium]|nr:patatin-like phospholipase family protein [Myxococcales bacterium]
MQAPSSPNQSSPASPETHASDETLRTWLQAAPFTLAMSSGFFGFFAHCGVLQALEEQGLLPQSAAGSSAGALVTGAWAAGLSAASLRDELLSLQRRDFWDPGFGLGLLKGRLFQERLRRLLPNHRFEECRIPLSVSVYDLRKQQTIALQQGDLISAIQASCAFPFMFQPVRIKGRPYLDGGIADRPGLLGVPEEERIFFHHLASRSPWRRRNSSALKIPTRPNLAALVLQGLPRVGPFRLPEGKHAFQQAYEGTLRALDLPLEPNPPAGRWVQVHLETPLLSPAS